MTTNYKGALDEVSAYIKDAWLGASVIVGYVPELKYPGKEEGLPDPSKFWARLSTQEVLSGQKTLSENVVHEGSRRFETIGLIFVQIFAPKRVDSHVKIVDLACMVKDSLRGHTLNVMFRNARIKESPAENGCLRIIVICEYEYDEIS